MLQAQNISELRKLEEKVLQELRAGLKHGYFECSIKSEIAKGNKREVTFIAGKSHRYHISDTEIG